MKRTTLVLFITAIALFGCLMAPRAAVPYSVKPDNMGDDRCAQTGDNCICMMCKNGGTAISIFGLYTLIIHESNLYEGNCWFGGEDPYYRGATANDTDVWCTEKTIEDWVAAYLDPSAWPDWEGTYVRYFMYGFGPTTADFEVANRFCNNNLTMVTDIITRIDGGVPIPPPRNRTKCYLQAGVIPIYVYHTNGQQVSEGAMREFIYNLQEWPLAELPDEDEEVGPVIVTPEFRYNYLDPLVIAAVRAQIHAMETNCKKCLVALTPSEVLLPNGALSTEPVDRILLNNDGTFAGGAALYLDEVDVIGQSVLLTPEEDCDFYKQFNRRLNFSMEMVRKYGKPTVWLQFGIADAERSDGTCKWTRKDVAEFYEYVFMNTPAMVASGVIGLVQSGIMDDGMTGPCPEGDDIRSCGFGLIDIAEQPKDPVFASWFRACQLYYGRSELMLEGPLPSDCPNGICESDETYDSCSLDCTIATCGNEDCDNGETIETCPHDCQPQIFNLVPVAFSLLADPDKSYCHFAMNLGMYSLYDTSTRSEERTVEPSEPVYYCDDCLGPLSDYWLDNYPQLQSLADALAPYWLYLASDDSAVSPYGGAFEAQYCDHLEITMGIESSKCELDPMLLRALAWNNTWEEYMLADPIVFPADVFNCYENFTATYVPISDDSCNPSDDLVVTHPTYVPPDGLTNWEICFPPTPYYIPGGVFVDTATGACARDVPPARQGEQCKPCEIGLILSQYLPFDQDSGVPEDTAPTQLVCNPNYNPFSARDSICAASSRMCNYLDDYNGFTAWTAEINPITGLPNAPEESTSMEWLYAPDLAWNGMTRIQNLEVVPDPLDPAVINSADAYNRWLLTFISLVQYEVGTVELTNIYDDWVSTQGCADPVNILNYCRWIKAAGPALPGTRYTTLALCIAAGPGACWLHCCDALGANVGVPQRCWDNKDCCRSCAVAPCPEGTCQYLPGACVPVTDPLACEINPIPADPDDPACGTNKCCGNPNFFDYVCSCNSDRNGDGSPDWAPLACDTLARYLYLIEKCDTLCYDYNFDEP